MYIYKDAFQLLAEALVLSGLHFLLAVEQKQFAVTYLYECGVARSFT